MINNKTLDLYRRVIKNSLANKNEIIQNKDNLLRFFNELPATSQRIAIAAFRFFKNEFNINEDDITSLKSISKFIPIKRISLHDKESYQ